MKKITITLSIIWFISTLTFAQGWVKTYGADTLFATSGIRTQDGGFIHSGKKNLNSSSQGEQFLLKTNSEGDIQWLQEHVPQGLGDLLTAEGYAYTNGIVELAGGGFVTTTPIRWETDGSPVSYLGTYIRRIDALGNEVWSQYYEFGMSDNSQFDKIIQDSDGHLVLAGYQTDSILGKVSTLLKLDTNGNEIFSLSYEFDTFSYPYYIKNIIQTQNEDYVLVGQRYINDPTIFPDEKYGFILRTDKNGNVIWQQEIDAPEHIRFEDIFENELGEFILTGINGLISQNEKIHFTHLDADGNILINKKIETNFQMPHWGKKIKPIGNGNYAITGTQVFPSTIPGYLSYFNPILVLIDSNGDVYSQRSYPIKNVGEAFNLEVDPDGGFYLLGGIHTDNNAYVVQATGTYILKTDENGHLYSGEISGKLFRDNDHDCTETEGDIPLEGWFVKAEGEETFYAYSNAYGEYNIDCDTGEYQVTVTPPNELWGLDCAPNGETVSLLDSFPSIDSLDFFLIPTYNCPVLDVQISTPFLRRCFNNNIYISYCNNGLMDEQDTWVEVTLDPFLEYVSSTVPFVSQSGDTYTFDIGLLEQGDCGSFRIEVYLNCDSTILGQTHCSEVHIYPDTLCVPHSPNWDESEIEVEVECEGDSVKFKIINIGSGDMMNERFYNVFEDHIMREQGGVQLLSGEQIIFSYPKNGATWRLIAEQSLEHPDMSMFETAAVEGCVAMEGDPFSLGMVNIFGDFSESSFEDIHCEENRGSYDPNDKAAVPFGYGEEHYIEKTDMLEYKIRFQNTGTDTAFTVVIRDQLSEYLDPTTLHNVIASHPYEMDLSQTGLLEFTFNNIHLPDSTTNEPASHGFVQFKIKQQANNALGTVIENDAGIYFDFNEPIITNTTYHTIGENFYLTTSVHVSEENETQVEVYPNPFTHYTYIRIKDINTSRHRLDIYHVNGKNMFSKEIDNEYLLKRNELPPGVYFFKIQSLDEGKTYTGKIVIQ